MNCVTITIWSVLDIEQTDDERSIKRAYARQLKANRPEDDQDAFQRLRDAYEQALRLAQHWRQESSAMQTSAMPAEMATPVEVEVALEVAAPAKTADAVEPPARAAARPQPIRQLFEQPGPAAIAAQMAAAAREADTIWLAFIKTAHVSPRLKLNKLFDSVAMLNFMVREAFELKAAQYCSDAECPEVLGDAIVIHFGWQNDVAHLFRLAPQAAEDAVDRYRARQSRAFLARQTASEHAFKLLLENRRPRYGRDTPDAKFTHGMKQLIEALRWQHPELLRYEIDAEIVKLWEQKVNAKRYFVQTGIFSMLAGMPLFFLAYCGMLAWFNGDDMGWPLFFAAQAVSFTLFALFCFRPPTALLAAVRRLKQDRLDVYLHQRRHEPAWQHGWLLPFAALTLLMFMVDPGPVARYALTLGLFGCMLAALFAGSAQLSLTHWFFVATPAIATAFLMLECGYRDAGLWACIFASICAFTLALRGGEHLYAATKLPPALLPKVRCAWLLGCIVLYLGLALNHGVLPGLALAMLAWLWCLAGLLLSRFVFSAIYIWPGLMALRFLVDTNARVLKDLQSPQLALLIPAIAVVAFFMLLNMYHAAKEKRHFS